MPRVNIYFTNATLEKLKQFIKIHHDGHRAVSLTVQQAVNEFLKRQTNVKPEKSNT